VKTWWLSNQEAMNLRSENGWTIDLQPHIVTATTHDDADTTVVADEETYETHYGLRDPMIDVLHRSYLHAWTIKGAHARFVTYAEHTTSRLLEMGENPFGKALVEVKGTWLESFVFFFFYSMFFCFPLKFFF
jgi:hypothetical protein